MKLYNVLNGYCIINLFFYSMNSFSGRYFQLIDYLKGSNGNIVKHSHFYLGCAYLVFLFKYYLFFIGC